MAPPQVTVIGIRALGIATRQSCFFALRQPQAKSLDYLSRDVILDFEYDFIRKLVLLPPELPAALHVDQIGLNVQQATFLPNTTGQNGLDT